MKRDMRIADHIEHAEPLHKGSRFYKARRTDGQLVIIQIFPFQLSPEQYQVFEDKGVKILIDKKSLLYLLGTTLDFTDGLNGKGFQFINPNASRTCGCGESFAV